VRALKVSGDVELHLCERQPPTSCAGESRLMRMGLRLMILAAAIVVVSPAAAFAGATRHGARHVVIHSVIEEGGTVIEPDRAVHATCKRTKPRHFYCSFINVTIGRKGSVRVAYARHRYMLGPIRYEPRAYVPECKPNATCPS
jgi:hypothetical protein